MQKIAVWNTAFLGDAVLTLPLIQNLKKLYPQAEIHYYLRAGFQSLFTHHPAIDKVIPYNKSTLKGLWSLSSDIAKERYDIWIGTHLSARSSFVALRSGAKKRIGFQESALSSLAYTSTIKRDFGLRKEHEVERLLRLLAPLTDDASILHTWDFPEIHVDAKTEQSALAYLNGIDKPILGINPASVWHTKCWLPEYFASVAMKAIEAGGHVMLFASPKEKPYTDAVLAHIPQEYQKEISNLTGKTSLTELAFLQRFLACYLTNDSGPMHTAWAQKTPVAALFGPTVKKLGFMPYGEQSHVFEADIPCRPCGLHGHKTCPEKHFRCMKDIHPEHVWKGIAQYF